MPLDQLRSLSDLGRDIDPGAGRRRAAGEPVEIGVRPRRRVRRVLASAALLAIVSVAYVAIVAGGQFEELDEAALLADSGADADEPRTDEPGSDADAAQAQAAGDAEGSAADPAGDGEAVEVASRSVDAAPVSRSVPGAVAVTPFAKVGTVTLSAADSSTRAVFLQARRGSAKELEPVGELVADGSAGAFTAPPDRDGLRYHVLPSLGEPWPVTSAVVLLLAHGGPVHAPVDGTVTEVARYPTEDGGTDVRIRIVPDVDATVAVEVRHLSAAEVSVGDAVTAGSSVLGRLRSQSGPHPAEGIAGEGQGPLRIEVRPAVKAPPPDPNAPAEPAEG